VNVFLVLATLFVGVQLVVLVVNVFTFPVLTPATPPRRVRRVSVLIPARNEEANLPETLPRVLAQGAHEVLVLDDGSGDRTPEILALLAAQHAPLKVLKGAPLPRGWSGKNWACHQLAEAATGDLLVFTDADVFWEEGALDALLAFQQGEGAVFMSVWPRQRTGSFFERLAVPSLDFGLLCWLPYLAVKRLPHAAFSAGNGQLMLWTKGAYKEVGGHAAFRGEVLEDVRMGQRAKGAGLRVALALGGEVLSARMYRSRKEVLEGFSKNIVALHGSRALLVLSLLLNTLAYTLAWFLALLEPLWLLPALTGVFQRALVAFKTHRSPLEGFLQPLAAYPLLLIGLRALRAKGYTWKGRTYGG